MSAEIQNKKLIFVGGSVRSGTTLLNLIVANDPKALALGEVQHIFQPYKKEHYEKIELLRKDKIWEEILAGGKRKLYTNLIRLFPEKDIFVDSSKNPFWYRSQIAYNRNLSVKNIMVYKHPLDLKQSLEKRNSKNWENIFTKYYKRYFSLVKDFRSISLHTLINNDKALEELCRYLEIPYFMGKREYWQQKHPNFFGSDTVVKKKISLDNLIANWQFAKQNARLMNLSPKHLQIRNTLKALTDYDVSIHNPPPTSPPRYNTAEINIIGFKIKLWDLLLRFKTRLNVKMQAKT